MLALAAGVLSFAASVHAKAAIDWRECSPNPLIECGLFQVPLDYANSSVGNATLAVTRYKAYREPRLGSIFTNPGGPGGSGSAWIYGRGELVSNATNGQYDIVGWDPRGVNLTAPGISCGFKTQSDLEALWNDTILGAGIEARGNFTDQKDIDYFYDQVNKTQQKAEEFGEACVAHDGGFLKYMGTTSVVRDMVALSDALEGEGKLINFWGISYGTIVGSYFVNMFPNRVGRVIIDGVVDSLVWATEPAYKGWSNYLASSEATLSGFAEACAQAGPQGCAISQQNSTAASITEWIRELIDTAYDARRPDIYTSFSLRSDLFNSMYTPKSWATLAEDLFALKKTFLEASANATGASANITRREIGQFPSVLTNGTNEVSEVVTLVAIECLDNVYPGNETMKDAFDELLRVTHDVSPTFGVTMAQGAAFICNSFPVRSVELFTGPFNHTLANPILVIGNEADPITPFASAKAVADRLDSSAYLVEQDDYGHASLAERSDCTMGVVNDYFVHGKVPDKGKFCGTNQVLFPGSPITKGTVSAALGVSSTSDDSDTDDSDVRTLKKQRNVLIAVTGSLGVATLLLAVTLLVTCARNRRNKRYAPPTAAFSVKHDSGMESMGPYSDPWEGRKTQY